MKLPKEFFLKIILVYKRIVRPKKFRIVQCSGPRTASTVLANLLYGIFSPKLAVNYENYDRIQKEIVLKTHNLSQLYWERKLYNYKVFYICSTRLHHTNPPESFTIQNNVIVFDYKEINLTESYTTGDICMHVLSKLKKDLPTDVWPDFSDEEILRNMIHRFDGLNQRCEEIKDRPFSYFDEYFHVHGGHRNRGNTQ